MSKENSKIIISKKRKLKNVTEDKKVKLSALDLIHIDLVRSIQDRDLDGIKSSIDVAYLEGIKLNSGIIQQALDLNIVR